MKSIFATIIMSLTFISSASAYEVDVNKAYRVYDSRTGELIVDIAFEPHYMNYDGIEVVDLMVYDKEYGDCIDYEFQNVILEKIPAHNIIR